MSSGEIAAALQRVARVLERRPSAGMKDDAPAFASWSGGLRVVTSHADGLRIATDLPAELGGAGDCVSPGWLFRAGLGACAVTSIAMLAAARGIELATLDVRVESRSDTRAVVGVTEADGRAVYPGPRDVRLAVRIGAHGADATALRELVQSALRRSPIPCAVETPTALDVGIEVVGDGAGRTG